MNTHSRIMQIIYRFLTPANTWKNKQGTVTATLPYTSHKADICMQERKQRGHDKERVQQSVKLIPC